VSFREAIAVPFVAVATLAVLAVALVGLAAVAFAGEMWGRARRRGRATREGQRHN
jgi:hypothetical protein